MDRISGLSNETICHIVSFLSAKEAAFATVLSKRWHNLYTIIPILEFDDTFGRLKDHLNGLLALPASSRILSCSLKCRTLNGPNRHALFNRFLCNVLKRGVMNLKLDIWVTLDGSYSLPYEIFTCKTLVRLELGSILEINLLPENALLPALKCLFIVSVRFSDHCGCAFQKLLSACPVLADLTLHNVEWEQWEWSRTVSSPTLKRLGINHRYANCLGIIPYDLKSISMDLKSVSMDTPNLTYLKYFDFAPKSYPIVNLSSLVEATVSLTLPEYQSWSGRFEGGDHESTKCDITNLITGLRNVEILDIFDTMTMETFYFFREAIPVFEKLHRLTVTTEQKSCMRTLPYLLKKSPNLKTLVIEGTLHYYRPSNNDYDDELDMDCYVDNGYDEEYDELDEYEDDDLVCECVSDYAFLLSCPVKVLEITKFNGTRGELVQMKHFLEKLSSLELVKVSYEEIDEEEQVRLRNSLLNLPRSSKCKIEFEFIPPESL